VILPTILMRALSSAFAILPAKNSRRGRSASFALYGLGGRPEPEPGQPGRLELGDQARASLLLDAERGPAVVLLELLQEPGPREGPLVAGELGPEGPHEGGGAHLAVNLSVGAVAGGGPLTLIPDPFRPDGPPIPPN